MAVKHIKPKPDLVIYLRRRYPEEVPAHALAEVMAALQGILEPVSPESQPLTVNLFDITRGSAAYKCTTSNPGLALPHLRLVGEWIRNGQPARGLGDAFPHIRTLSDMARRVQTDVEVRAGANVDSPLLLRVSQDTFDELKSHHTVTGMTTIVGEILRIGGATKPRCMVRVLNQRSAIYCTTSVEQARQLAARLYETVALEGRAVWLTSTRDILEFDVTDVLPYARSSFAEVRRQLRAAGADRWDHQELEGDE